MSDSEKLLQAHAVSALMKLQLRGLPILFAGDMAAGRRSGAEQVWAKATGLVRGEPDLRVYGPRGRVLFIELKKVGGRVSKEQRERHGALMALGHEVRLAFAETGEDMALLVTDLVLGWLEGGR